MTCNSITQAQLSLTPPSKKWHYSSDCLVNVRGLLITFIIEFGEEKVNIVIKNASLKTYVKNEGFHAIYSLLRRRKALVDFFSLTILPSFRAGVQIESKQINRCKIYNCPIAFSFWRTLDKKSSASKPYWRYCGIFYSYLNEELPPPQFHDNPFLIYFLNFNCLFNLRLLIKLRVPVVIAYLLI